MRWSFFVVPCGCSLQGFFPCFALFVVLLDEYSWPLLWVRHNLSAVQVVCIFILLLSLIGYVL